MAHPQVGGFFLVVFALIAAAVGVSGLVGLVRLIADGFRHRRLDAGGLGIALALMAAGFGGAVGLGAWGFRLWFDWVGDIVTVLRVALAVVTIAGALFCTLFGAGLFLAGSSDDKERRQGIWLTLAALPLWAGATATIFGLGPFRQAPETAAHLAAVAASIPAIAWIASLVLAAVLALALNPGLRAMAGATLSSGDTRDASHAWTDHRGIGWGTPTRSEVYDHYHGRGSWGRMVQGWLIAGRVVTLATPVVAPLALVHWVWYDVWSGGGALLATMLAVLSLGTARLTSR